ncbi:hypothetical protein SESBI_21749 [Sesbania bispinosa]|nr:hypothetical protein SESBI_21749 [Sesbania bispinosa]
MWVGTSFVGHGFYSSGHHGGDFVNGRTVRYEGGEVHAIHNIDIENWSYFEALGLVKDLGYCEKVSLWWNVAKGRMNRTFRSIGWDSHALEMGNYALLHNCEVDLYVEHTQIVDPILLEDSALLTYNKDGENENVEGDGIGGAGDTKFDEGDVEQGDDVNGNAKGCGEVDVNDFNDGSDFDDGTNDLHFSDSEEDRDLGMDDGFEDNNDQQNMSSKIPSKEKKAATGTTAGNKKAAGTTGGTTFSSKNKKAATGTTDGTTISSKNKKTTTGTTVAGKKAATGGNECGQQMEVDGVQFEIPSIPEYAKNLTTAQLLARMMATNKTWAQVVTGHQPQVQSTQSEVTMQEQDGVMPTQNSEVGQQDEDVPTNPEED